MKQRLLAATMAAVMVLGGCSGGGQTAQTTASESKETTAAKETAEESKKEETSIAENTEVIEIEFWHALETQYEPTLNKVVDEFNKTHDNIVVKPMYIGAYAALNEAIVAAHAAGAGLPGVAMANIPFVAGYGAGGVCEDLGPYIEQDGFELEDFGEGLRKAGEYEGAQIALPFLVSTEVVYYNNDLMKELGLEMPEKWADMTEFLEKGSIVENGESSRYGMVIPGWNTFYYGPFFVNNGVEPLKEDGTTGLGDESAVKVVQQMKDWCDAGYTYLATGKDAASVMRQNFVDGKALSVVYTSSLYNTMVDLCDFEVGMSWLPSGDTKNQELGGNVLFIPSKNSQEVKDASWEFLAYLMSKEVNMIWASETGYLPTRKSVQETEEGKKFLEQKPAFETIFENLDLISPGIQHSAWNQASTIWVNYIDEIITENLDVKEAMENMAAEINEVLEDF